MDTARADSFRLAFTEAAKKMDPLDALVLKEAQVDGGVIVWEDTDKKATATRETPGIQNGCRRLRSDLKSRRSYERPALRKPFAAFPADSKVA
jgi:hypothetical protein